MPSEVTIAQLREAARINTDSWIALSAVAMGVVAPRVDGPATSWSNAGGQRVAAAAASSAPQDRSAVTMFTPHPAVLY
jgi:hypothetical protein